MEVSDQVQRLDPVKAVFGSIFLVSNRLETVGNRFLGELTTKQWFLLAVVDTFFSEPPTLTEVAQLIHISYQNIKQIALKLEQKGFVQLRRAPRDRRAWHIHVTERAREYSQERQQRDQAFVQGALSGLDTAQCRQLLGYLLQIAENVRALSERVEEET